MEKPIELHMVINKATPLTEASYYILIALSEPLHGYGVMQKVVELSSGRVQLGPGTLYGALSNLQSLGLIESVDGNNDERRKIYRITRPGMAVAGHEVERFEELARNGRILLKM